MQVLLVLGLACFLLVLLVGSLLVLYCSHASSSPDRSKRGSLDEERRERDGLLHACVACLLCLRCPSCLCFCCRRRRREKSPATVQQAADATDVALVTLESGEHVPRTKTPALVRSNFIPIPIDFCCSISQQLNVLIKSINWRSRDT